MTDISLTDTQNEAVNDIKNWFENDISTKQCWYLAGFAGVGKSTVVRHIIDALGLSLDGPMPDVLTATFTAKAALVISRMGTPASTIHKLIYITRRCTPAEFDLAKAELERLKAEALACDDYGERFAFESRIAAAEMTLKEMRGLKRTLNLMSRVRDAKLIVIDEVSMVDADMGRDLMSFGKPILVVGDPGQLPPIRGQGFFTSGKPDTMLTEIHRQAADNPIIRLATMARQGQFIPFGRYGDTVFKIPRAQLTDPRMLVGADQVLCGLNRTRFMLNNEMRKVLGLRGLLPEPSDKIICLKNNYDLGVINGMFMTVDQVKQIDERRFQAVITTEDGDIVGAASEDDPAGVLCYSGHYADHLIFDKERDERDWKMKGNKLVESTFGYAISVHKAQGSGFGNVIFWDDGWGAGRPAERAKLLYTAITRAVSGLLIVE
jgi:exodeoxyribonuclease-5